MVGFVNVVRFNAASGGTGDFVVGPAVTGYQTPASAGAVNGTIYSYRAESADLSQWEIGTGAYTSGSATLARTTVIASSTGSKVSFSAAPQVAMLALAGDLVVNPTSSTNTAAVRYSGTDGRAHQNSALLIADTTGALSRSGGGGIPLQGTNTNDSASAGDVGEYVSSSVASGSAVSLTTGTPANVTSISLTAGDWDVSIQGYFNVGATTNVTDIIVSASSISTTLDTTVGRFNQQNAPARAGTNGLTLGPIRFSLSATTTVYLIGYSDFTTSTNAAYGIIRARRIR